MESDSDFNYEELADVLERGPFVRLAPVPKTDPLEYLSDKETIQRFRFCKQSINNLLQLLLERNRVIPNSFLKESNISPKVQLLVALKFFATGNFQLSNGDLHHMCQGSVSKIVKNISKGIASLRPMFVNYPSFEEAGNSREEFLAIGNFPGVIGAIDCTHVKIRSPGGVNAEMYRNRKGYFSVNVQGVCNAKLEFINCVVRWPGAVHDSRIFDSSLLRAQLGDREVPGMLVGDSGYPTLPYLMTPFETPRTPQEKRFNKALVKTRNTIERAFGILKRRFHCVKSELRTKLSTSLSIIVSCIVLHNFAIKYNEILDEEEDFEDQQQELNPPVQNHSASGLATRRTLVQTYFN